MTVCVSPPRGCGRAPPRRSHGRRTNGRCAVTGSHPRSPSCGQLRTYTRCVDERPVDAGPVCEHTGSAMVRGPVREGLAVSPPTKDRTRPFVGRERELDELRAALADAEAGRGGVFLLGGEPGIGKSRLMEVVAIQAQALGW